MPVSPFDSLFIKNIVLPQYNKNDVSVGIAHIGPGAFHRAHQAVYVHQLLNMGHLNWGICEISIHSRSVKNALEPQNYTYTLAQLDQQIEYHAIDSIKECIVAPDTPDKAIEKLASIDIRLITLTITEKGYYLNANGCLDQANTDITNDLSNLDTPKTALGYIVAGLKRRFDTHQQPVCIMSCDNLIDNGKKLRQSVLQFSEHVDREFAHWIEKHIAFPCTMVDSITPATTDELRQQVRLQTTINDAWPIQREGFCQWVIEDISDEYDCSILPEWPSVGVTISRDVAAYEAAKLRMLNGTHSSLAMLGSLFGLETVEQAIKQPVLRKLIKRMLRDEIIPSLNQDSDIHYSKYAEDIIARYENPNIKHLLSQIAWDSSQKLPIRLLATIEDLMTKGISPKLLGLAIAGWMHFIMDKVEKGDVITDPMAEELTRIAQAANNENIVSKLLGVDAIFSRSLAGNTQFTELVNEGFSKIGKFREQSLSEALRNF